MDLMNFRKDINGLRAIAVIAVVLFHFNAAWVPGGFAGVDVFFVISGYLMTSIIFRGIEKENFSIYRFYVARANRIIPALAVLCLFLFIFGWFFLSPIDYRTLGSHVASSLTFVSNIVYWRESGYFDVSSHSKWLLHTWSLSVEWQFYIIYPIFLVFMRKYLTLRAMKTTLFYATILGFVFCVVATAKWSNPSYYLLPTRAWEMMMGGLAFLYPFSIKESKKKFIEWTGLFLIIGSYFFISKENAWPGYLALFPVLGTFLVIQAQNNNSFIMGNVILQKIGTWSYSIYLWHWPLVVVIYYFSLHELYVYLGLALSVLLGFISNRYIEKIKFRNDFINAFQYLKCKPVYMALCLSLVGGGIFQQSGFLFRVSDELQKMNVSAIESIDDLAYPSPNLTILNKKLRFIKGKSDKNILFIGASHIEHTYPYVEALKSDYNIYYLTQTGCFISPSFSRSDKSCTGIQEYREIIEKIKFDKIVTSIYFINGYLPEKGRKNALAVRISEYNDFLRYAKSKSKQVFVILGEPDGPEFDPLTSIRKNLNKYINVLEVREDYTEHNYAIKQLDELNNVIVIDPIDFLCSDICQVMDENYNYYYKDDSHMRPWYAIKALTYLNIIFDEINSTIK
jgi:peptidoglycan/LPS O-acetylase OafA/YrhL